MPRPGRFVPGKETWYPLYRRLGGHQGRSGRVLKISTLPGFDPRTVQSIASRYTDYAILIVDFACICLYAKYASQLEKHVGASMEKITLIVVYYFSQALECINYRYMEIPQ